MLRLTSPTRTDARNKPRRPHLPTCESLEDRIVANGSSASVDLSVAKSHPAAIYHAQAVKANAQHAIGTISGTVANSFGFAMRGVRVQLINSQGNVIRTTTTNGHGVYRLNVIQNGAYVVRALTPNRFVQTTPLFATTPPQGSLAPGAGSSSWSYNTGNSNPAFGPVGVYSWDTIAPAGNEPFQSPINISTKPTDLTPFLRVNYSSATPSQIVNNGHQIQVQFSGSSADTISLLGQNFELAQFHYHDPSEHQVNGQGYSMEEHFVNVSATGAETVIAVFLQLGAHNASLQPVLDAATADLTTAGSSTTTSTPIDFSGLLPSNLTGWFYQGSLTTPPLSQPVNWVVLATPITLDSAQLKQYETVANAGGFLPNARPVQPLDGRQLNEFNFDVNFQNQSVAGLNFQLIRV